MAMHRFLSWGLGTKMRTLTHVQNVCDVGAADCEEVVNDTGCGAEGKGDADDPLLDGGADAALSCIKRDRPGGGSPAVGEY